MKRNSKLILFVLILASGLILGCAGKLKRNPERDLAGEPELTFAEALAKTGRNIFFANLHAHHFLENQVPESFSCEQGKGSKATPASGESAAGREPARSRGGGPKPPAGRLQYDDGRPCKNNSEGKNDFVKFDTLLDYFKGACDYAKNEGKLDILYVSVHTKTGTDPQADTTLAQIQERHQALASINSAYDGKFHCGLGQEASSIGKGNHLGIYGQFPIASAEITQPFYFPAGRFDQFYPELKSRVEAGGPGGKIILQMNHPDVHQDLWWNSLSWMKKETNNDYGLDDFEPLRSLIQARGEQTLNNDLLRSTYTAIRDAGGDRFRLIEVAETGGALGNPSVVFNSTQSLMPQDGDPGVSTSNLYDYIFYLNMGFKISPTGNQDNHNFNFGTASTTRTGVLARSLSEEDVLEALDTRKTFASEDKDAQLLTYVTEKDKTAVMGDGFTTEAGTIQFSVGYQDPEEADKTASIRIYYYQDGENLDFNYKTDQNSVQRVVSFPDGTTVSGALPSGPTDTGVLKRVLDVQAPQIQSGQVKTFTIPVPARGQYIFVELLQTEDHDRLWSAPIWITTSRGSE